MSSIEFKLPDIGEGVHEGEIVRWIVPIGGAVSEDDPVVEVMTDKATVEIPSPATGTITQHLFGEGDVANVGDVIFLLESVAGGRSEVSPAAAEAVPPTAAAATTPDAVAIPVASGGELEFKLPDVGEGVQEGEIVRWMVAEGDNIALDQPMVAGFLLQFTPCSLLRTFSSVNQTGGEFKHVFSGRWTELSDQHVPSRRLHLSRYHYRFCPVFPVYPFPSAKLTLFITEDDLHHFGPALP